MIDYHKVTKNYSIKQLIINYLRAFITLFFTYFKTASQPQHVIVIDLRCDLVWGDIRGDILSVTIVN